MDIEPQPKYPFTMWSADAFHVLNKGISGWAGFTFDAIHADPPGHIDRERLEALLEATGLPWVIVTVVGREPQEVYTEGIGKQLLDLL